MKRPDDFVPSNHPLRSIREMVNKALVAMNGLFADMYEADIKGGRPSVAPEKLLRAMLLQVLYSVRSERMLMEQIQYNMLFRWFVGLAMDDAVWVPTVFTKNRQRLIEHDAVVELFNQILAQADERQLLSGEHFSVDGTRSKPGLATKVLYPKTARMVTTAMAPTSAISGAATRPTSRARTVMRGCTAKARPPANCASWATH